MLFYVIFPIVPFGTFSAVDISGKRCQKLFLYHGPDSLIKSLNFLLITKKGEHEVDLQFNLFVLRSLSFSFFRTGTVRQLFFLVKNKNYHFFLAHIFLLCQNIEGNKFFHTGDSPKWVKSKRRRRKKESEQWQKQWPAMHCNATSCGARKAAWANLSNIYI